MPQVVIENPILNSPYVEPIRHFRFSDEGITDEIVESRRVSSYFMPIPAAKKKGKQLAFDTEWTRDRVEENKFINRVRVRVAQWRTGHWAFVEMRDPWNTQTVTREILTVVRTGGRSGAEEATI